VATRELNGSVVKVEGGRAVIQLEPDESCGGGFSCACCSLSRREGQVIRIEAQGLEPGEAVRVSVPGYAGYVSSLVVFLLPVALFMAGVLVGGLFEGAEGARGTASVLGGVCGFALAVLIAVAVNRLLRNAYRVRRAPGPEA